MPRDVPLGPIDDSLFKPGARLPSPPARRLPRPATLSVLAVASLVLGAVSPFLICVCYTALLPSLAAIITGHIAYVRIRRSAGALTGSGMSIAGLVLGYVSFTLTAILLGFYIAGLWPPDFGGEIARAPGELELLEVERQIVSDDNGYALGNTAEARELALRFADEMKVLDESLFTQTDATLKLSGGQYVTWCELRDGQCAFIVHVPEYRRFEDDAKEALAELAWMTAQVVVSENLEPGDDLAVGLKGVLLYGAVMVGEVEIQDEEPGARMFESDTKRALLFPYFVPEDPPTPRQPAAPAVSESPQIPRPVRSGESDSTPVAPPESSTPPVASPAVEMSPVAPEESTPVTADPPESRTQRARTRRITPETVEEALEFLQGDDTSRQRRALYFLERQEPDAPNPAVVEALFEQLDHEDDSIRSMIARSLSTWATADDLDRLEPLIDDENTLVQMSAVETIALLGTPEAAEVLAARLTDREQCTRVTFRLVQMGDVAEKPVLALLREPDLDPVASSQIIYVLGEVGGRDSSRVLRRMAASERHPQRFAAGAAAQKIQMRLAD